MHDIRFFLIASIPNKLISEKRSPIRPLIICTLVWIGPATTMLVEAANAAFVAKSMESLNALEGMARDREDVLRTINSLKLKLINK